MTRSFHHARKLQTLEREKREREGEKEKDIDRETNDRENGVIMDCNYIN